MSEEAFAKTRALLIWSNGYIFDQEITVLRDQFDQSEQRAFFFK